MELNHRNLHHVFSQQVKVFSSKGCLYFKSSDSRCSKLNGLEYQLAKFSILTYPGFGMPLKAGDFFSINMVSGKWGLYYTVASAVKEDMGEVIAFFIGYLGEGVNYEQFYEVEEMKLLISSWKKMGLSINKECFYHYSEL